MSSRNTVISALLLYLVLGCAVLAFGAVSQDEASKLGTTLTGVGAEKEGNADGSIPAYTGGLTTAPRGFVKGSGVRPDPFSSEKPLFSINAKNMDQYADKLTEGVKAMMKKYPSFRIDVYKSHRTAALPGYVLENTKKNATSATLSKGGYSLQNAHAGIPFPIPADGYQAMWNHQAHFFGPGTININSDSYNIDSAGVVSLSLKSLLQIDQPYYDTSVKKSELILRLKFDYTGPPRRAGEKVLLMDPLDYTEKGRRAWTYLPGQRRVRLAPDIAFDTPNPGTAGASTYDDTYVFNGSMERYAWKLVGKKEIYIPYNTYKLTYHKGDVKTVLQPRHMNPDFVRWELHRVWVVEATLRPGKRHVYTKRTFYIDEDSWAALSADEYDKRGNMYRVTFAHMAPSYDVMAPDSTFLAFYDLIARSYAVNLWPRAVGGIKYTGKQGDKFFSPEALAAEGIR